MRLFKIMLSLMALLIWSAMARADYNPANPPEPGVNFSLTTGCVPAEAGYGYTSSGTYSFGTTVWMNVYSNTGFKFVDWEDGEGNVVSTSRSFNYTMPPQDVTLVARFVYDPENPDEPGIPEIKYYSTVYTQVVPAEAGYINQSSGETYEVGSVVRYRAYAYNNYVFKNWTRDGEVISESQEFQYTIPKEDHTLVANFEYSPANPDDPGMAHPYRVLSLISNMEGSGSLYGAGSYPDGTSVRVQANVNDYYTFINWTDETGDTVSQTRVFDYIMPARNVTLTANYSYDYNPANPAEPDVPSPPSSVGENMVAFPRFGMWDDAHVMILCETPGATIHYTLDGTDPDATSAVYSSPVYVESNLLVKAIALKDGMEDSPIRSFQVTAYHAAAPVFSFVKRKVHISSDTHGATIRFTTDFTDPTEESEVYTTPFEPEENCRIKAYASKEGLTDSNISIYVYRRADNTLAPPSFKMDADGNLVIVAAIDGGVTHYTLDGTDPDETSSEYTSPLKIDEYTVVRAYTTHEDYFDSAIAEYIADLVVAEKQAVVTEIFREREMLIDHPESLDVMIVIDNSESMIVATPYRLEIVPGMSNVSVTALATGDHRANSEPVEIGISFHQPPVVAYDGHTLAVAPGEDESAYPIDTMLTYNGISQDVDGEAVMEISEFGFVSACNMSDFAYRSEPVELTIDFFNTGTVVGVRDGHHLSEVFGTWEENRDSDSYLYNYVYLRVVGELELEDLGFIASLPALSTLHLDADKMPEDSTDGIFSGSRIETICSNAYPDGMLKNMPRITTVMWSRNDSQMPEGRLTEAGNPNVLMWVTDSDLAPSDAVNVVRYVNTGDDDYAGPDNTEVSGWAESLQLISGYPFNVHNTLEAGSIEFIKEFNMPTEIDVCQGWESIVLPFTPTSIVSLENGENLLPYSQWSMSMMDYDTYSGPKPFWLYGATSNDWVAASDIEAGMPYIISMPNNPYYIDSFNISGNVMFSAENVRFEKGDCETFKSDWINGTEFKGSYMPVEESHLALNGWLETDDLRPGSAFVSDVEAKPFECYVTGFVTGQGNKYESRRSMPVFGNVSGLTLPTVNDLGFIVLPEGVGSILIISDKNRSVDIYAATGIRVRTVEVVAGENVIVDNIAKGIYIIGGRKVMVR